MVPPDDPYKLSPWKLVALYVKRFFCMLVFGSLLYPNHTRAEHQNTPIPTFPKAAWRLYLFSPPPGAVLGPFVFIFLSYLLAAPYETALDRLVTKSTLVVSPCCL